MMFHSIHLTFVAPDFEWNRSSTQIRIAGYCASSTESSDHSLKKKFFFFQISIVFFLRDMIKQSERKTGS